ncbi:acyl-CoA dehydrogenase family protein [Corynebacterium bovis]|uniref:acyl-CoA dehydrogenase family protein n=2 Tax=Corynebacterium bovis TaxID=36808 RepID=UPI00163B11B8|nr:acyl-CoA dehydrogenase family protein [Corynebacterium bovis]
MPETPASVDLTPLTLPSELASTVAENAKAVDTGDTDARYALPLLGEAGLLDAGAPEDRDGRLIDMVRTVRELSRYDLSVGFTVWATRMTLEYLRASESPRAAELAPALAAGERPGVTGMASAFKDFAGCGEVDLTAERVDGGYRVSGKLNWASNLYDDAVVVSAATTGTPGDGDATATKILFVVEAGAEGMTFGRPFGLLGLNATASAWVSLDGVFVADDAVLTTDLHPFLARVRPTFALLQISECIGVAEAAVAAAAPRLTGLNATFREDWDRVRGTVADLVERQEEIVGRVAAGTVDAVALLELRLDAAEAAVAAAGVEVRVAGGAGYARTSPASRRFREAAFIPVQSPSESQLRWELARARAGALSA